jgi:hypothetical protein
MRLVAGISGNERCDLYLCLAQMVSATVFDCGIERSPYHRGVTNEGRRSIFRTRGFAKTDTEQRLSNRRSNF